MKEDATYSADNSRHERAPTAEDRKYTNHNLRRRDAERNDIDRKHPLHHLLIDIQALLQVPRDVVVQIDVRRRGVVQLPHLDGIEPVAGLAGRAVFDRLVPRGGIFVAAAVVP